MIKRIKFFIRFLIDGFYIDEPIRFKCQCGENHSVFITHAEYQDFINEKPLPRWRKWLTS